MKFTLEITMDNAAFKDADGVDEDPNDTVNSYAAGDEVGRLLKNLADQVPNSGLKDRSSGTLIDYNGNRVGSWSVTS